MPERKFRRRGRVAVALMAAGTLTFTAAFINLAGLGGVVANASSHREAPIVAGDPQIDGTDTYAFTSPDKPDSVTVVANFDPFQLPPGGPNFNPFSNDARYNIKIDTNGDAKPDLTYRFTFSGGFVDKKTFLYNTGVVNNINDATLNFKQNYKVELVGADGAVKSTVVAKGRAAPANVGVASMPNYGQLRAQALATGQGTDGTRAFAGPADDPFFLDLRVFDLLYGGDLSETGNPVLTGLNVSSLAVQIPKSVLAANGLDASKVIGVHTTSERQAQIAINADGTRKPSGDWVQVSRLGNPLVNEVVSSVELKDAFNALPPEKDASVPGLVARVTDPEVPKLIEKIYKIPAPAAPRNDLVAVFLTGIKGLNQPTKPTPSEMMRLNTSTPVTPNPNRLGVLAGDTGGFPNGRRLTDDVVDIEVQTLEGAIQADGSIKLVQALAKGDGVDNNDVAFQSSFPYVALPHPGSNTGPGGLGGSAQGRGPIPSGGVATGAGGVADRTGSNDSNPWLPISAGLVGAALAGAGAIMLRRRPATS